MRHPGLAGTPTPVLMIPPPALLIRPGRTTYFGDEKKKRNIPY